MRRSSGGNGGHTGRERGWARRQVAEARRRTKSAAQRRSAPRRAPTRNGGWSSCAAGIFLSTAVPTLRRLSTALSLSLSPAPPSAPTPLRPVPVRHCCLQGHHGLAERCLQAVCPCRRPPAAPECRPQRSASAILLLLTAADFLCQASAPRPRALPRRTSKCPPSLPP